MKRSEMLEYLAQSLRKKDNCVTTNIHQCRCLAEKMLKSCETAGMKPPWCEPFSGKLLLQWESEDEA